MIKNIFLPDHVGNYYLFNQRFIGISIDRNSVSATQSHAQGNSIFISSSHTELLDATKAPNERIVAGLIQLKEKLSLPAYIQTSLPSAYVVFKELTLPFTSQQKIDLVVRFEVEPLLPFPIADAIVDFIITQKNEASCQIMVAAVQKQYIAQHLSYFEQADIKLDAITVDLFDVYNLYKQIPTYAAQQGFNVLLDLGSQSTRIMGVHNGQLRVIRSLAHGMQHVAKDISQTLNITPQQASEQLLVGIDQTNSANASAITQALTTFWNKIQFALGSLATQIPDAKTIGSLILFSEGAQIKSIDQFMHKLSGIPCSLFAIDALKENSRYRMEHENALQGATVTSLAAALPSDAEQDFNLIQNEFVKPNTVLFVKQVLVGLTLLILLFGSLLAHTIIQTRKLKNDLASSENEAILALQEQFPDLAEETDLDEIVSAAQESLKSQEKMWMAFSSQSRSSFLEYLLELSTRIHRQELGFVPKQIIIKDGLQPEIILDARVKDYEALKQLEQSLRESKLFSYVEGQHSPEFSMKILVRQEKQGI